MPLHQVGCISARIQCRTKKVVVGWGRMTERVREGRMAEQCSVGRNRLW